jgi:hypothetical protein
MGKFLPQLINGLIGFVFRERQLSIDTYLGISDEYQNYAFTISKATVPQPRHTVFVNEFHIRF